MSIRALPFAASSIESMVNRSGNSQCRQSSSRSIIYFEIRRSIRAGGDKCLELHLGIDGATEFLLSTKGTHKFLPTVDNGLDISFEARSRQNRTFHPSL